MWYGGRRSATGCAVCQQVVLAHVIKLLRLVAAVVVGLTAADAMVDVGQELLGEVLAVIHSTQVSAELHFLHLLFDLCHIKAMYNASPHTTWYDSLKMKSFSNLLSKKYTLFFSNLLDKK